MKQAVLLIAASSALLLAFGLGFGWHATFRIAHGAITIMSALIAGTFLWLWRENATPLALGMGLSWAGTASVMGWWWRFDLLGRPDGIAESEILIALLALQLAGAVLHFDVIQSSMGLGRRFAILPVAAAILASALVLAVH